MAECEICELHSEGTMSFLHCINAEKGVGCKGCVHKCTKEAFYIGGKNICTEHLEAFHNRFTEYWNHPLAGTPVALLIEKEEGI